MQRVTVIGGTGFVGDYLTKELSGIQNIQLKVLYRNTLPSEKISAVEYIKIDIEIDKDRFYEILSETDCLIILSRPNVKLIQSIVNSELKFKKIIYTSTLLIYPSSSNKQAEDAELIPASVYEKDKISEEKMLINFAESSGVKLTIARLTNVYGDVKNRAMIHWILKALVNDQDFKLNNQGTPVRDFIFVSDVAKYLTKLLFLKQDSVVEIFNVCTGQGFSINQVIEKAESIANKKLKIAKGDITQEKLSVIGDNSKIARATGFNPEFNLNSGLKKAYKNYLK